MALTTGIVGLPNVGKSTLFNAITKAGAEAANYPFCTIEPNVGVVAIPDIRLNTLADIVKPRKVVPNFLHICDIAGLVKGASQGEGLGNRFLSHIREVDAILHVVRCFEDHNVTHVSGKIDPVGDIETISLELILADLETVERRIERIKNKKKSGEKEAFVEHEILAKLKQVLEEGKPVRSLLLTQGEKVLVKSLNLLTIKNVLYVANVSEEDIGKTDDNIYVKQVKRFAAEDGSDVVTISAQVEAEIAQLEEEECQTFLQDLGIKVSGLDQLVSTAYRLLGLITYFTAGEKEVRAWTIRQGVKAPQAAGVIHSDFERGFICAEVVSYNDFIDCGSDKLAKEKGLLRLEGKEYTVHDGDVICFRFNV